MGTIKDVSDLVFQLYKSVKDRKIREELLRIREKLTELREDYVDQKATHVKEVEEIKNSYAKEIQALQVKLQQLQAENTKLREVIKKCKKNEAIRKKYEFDEDAKIYRDKDKKAFCPHCLHQDPPSEVPLGKPNHAWECSKCDHLYPNPDYKSLDINITGKDDNIL